MNETAKDTVKRTTIGTTGEPVRDIMSNCSATGNYYVLGHLVQFTGLTDRTLRNYISMGILQGEKINGLWHFTPEQVEAFVRHPAVRPSILAKKNAIVYDFLLDTG